MSYGPTELLGRKLNSAVYLRKLARVEMFTRLQVVRPLDDLTNAVYKRVEEKKHREQLDDNPHGDPWHVSFHASQFPGDYPLACPRAAVYGLMDFAKEAGDRKARNVPFDRAGRTIMAAGKAIEIELVQNYADDGILLSAKPSDEHQTGFQLKAAWLTGSVDCVVAWPGLDMAVPIEIKTKYQSAIDEMKLAKRGPDLKHIFQLKTQLALVRIAMAESNLWSEYKPPTHGYIYYLSRDRPSDTAEFRVEYDKKFFEAGIKRLMQWKQLFLDDVLPEKPKGKRTTNFGHPMGAEGFKWSQLPCQWCDYKKTCQLDFRQSKTALSDSVGIDRTKAARPGYDPAEAIKRVQERWAE
jgi:CRISPR/Cas system-associated exonuclease Cas4 (RecB family)